MRPTSSPHIERQVEELVRFADLAAGDWFSKWRSTTSARGGRAVVAPRTGHLPACVGAIVPFSSDVPLKGAVHAWVVGNGDPTTNISGLVVLGGNHEWRCPRPPGVQRPPAESDQALYHEDVRRPLRAFISTNKTICMAIERRLPQRRLDLARAFDKIVATQMTRLGDGAVVVDVGSGKECGFARHRPRDRNVRIIGVDASEEELIDNHDVDEKRVADITKSLPFDRAAVDLLASRSVLEHLSSTERFIAESARVLKPGGYSIHLCASRFAPFAVLNRFLPSGISQRLLDAFHPECRGRLGFRTFYDRTYVSGLCELLERNGFDIDNLKVSYYQSGYYNFFVPLYLLSALYELVLYMIGVDDLAARFMVVARKRVSPTDYVASSGD